MLNEGTIPTQMQKGGAIKAPQTLTETAAEVERLVAELVEARKAATSQQTAQANLPGLRTELEQARGDVAYLEAALPGLQERATAGAVALARAYRRDLNVYRRDPNVYRVAEAEAVAAHCARTRIEKQLKTARQKLAGLEANLRTLTDQAKEK